MKPAKEELYAEDYLFYLSDRNFIRKLIRRFYLFDIRKYCKGKTIDFGSGIGELLKILPRGSVGFEVNKFAVDYCKSKGLTVELYNPEMDDYKFRMIEERKYTTFTMNHVLEHLDNSSVVINKIFESCHKLEISMIVFTVPGFKGYKSDKTHQTFIDLNYFKNNRILENKYYHLKFYKYFPVNWKLFSRYFTHNELRLIFEKRK